MTDDLAMLAFGAMLFGAGWVLIFFAFAPTRRD